MRDFRRNTEKERYAQGRLFLLVVSRSFTMHIHIHSRPVLTLTGAPCPSAVTGTRPGQLGCAEPDSAAASRRRLALSVNYWSKSEILPAPLWAPFRAGWVGKEIAGRANRRTRWLDATRAGSYPQRAVW